MPRAPTAPLLLLLAACASRTPAPVAAPPPAAPPPTVEAAAVREAPDDPAPSPSPSPPAVCTPAPTPAAVTEDVPGCPDLASLVVVHRWHPDGAADPCGPPAWVASLGVTDARYFPGAADEAPPELPRYRALTDAEARAAGYPLFDTPLWVFAGENLAPCQATPGRVWASERAADGPAYVELARALTGCAFTAAQEGPFYALASPRRPAQCRFRAMPPRVDRGLAGLAPVRARTLTRPCALPRCRSSWSRAALTERGGTLDDVQAVYVFARRDMPACSWPRDWYHALTWTPRLGAPWAHLLATGPAAGVLVAASGAQAVITAQMGRVEVFPLSDEPNIIYPVQSRQWLVANEEASLAWTIQPSCL
ncbi:MAG: hypothetical protein U0324_30125 [Polyangiales bacterium]